MWNNASFDFQSSILPTLSSFCIYFESCEFRRSVNRCCLCESVTVCHCHRYRCLNMSYTEARRRELQPSQSCATGVAFLCKDFCISDLSKAALEYQNIRLIISSAVLPEALSHTLDSSFIDNTQFDMHPSVLNQEFECHACLLTSGR